MEVSNGVAVVSSRVVAKDFKKRPSEVNRKIKGLIEEVGCVQNCTDLFIESQYLDSQGKEQLEYLLTRDGFSLLVYGTFENPLFLAKDVAEWIDYSFANKEKGIRKVTQMLATVDEEEKVLGVTNVVTQNQRGGLRGNQERWFLTEDGLYEVLMQPRKPIAKVRG